MKKGQFGDVFFKLIAGGFIFMVLAVCHGVFRNPKDIIPFYYWVFPNKDVSKDRLYALTVFHGLTILYLIGLVNSII